jgi:YVTN family beta-propeller protein
VSQALRSCAVRYIPSGPWAGAVITRASYRWSPRPLRSRGSVGLIASLAVLLIVSGAPSALWHAAPGPSGLAVSAAPQCLGRTSCPTPAATSPASSLRSPRRAVGIATATDLPSPTGPLPDAVLGSVDLINETYRPGTVTAPHGLAPDGTASDPLSGAVYVADSGSGTVTVLPQNLSSITAVIPVGSDPFNLIFDPASAQIVVANWNSGNLSVIDPTTNEVVGTVPIGPSSGPLKFGPYGLAYDGTDRSIFVGELWSGSGPCTTFNITELNASSFGVIRTIPTGFCNPWSVTYDPGTGTVDVSYAGEDVVDAFDAGSGALGTQTTLPSEVWDAAAISNSDELAEFSEASGSSTSEVTLLGANNLTVEQQFTETLSNSNGTAVVNGMVDDPTANALLVGGANQLYAISLATHALTSVITTDAVSDSTCYQGLTGPGTGGPIFADDFCSSAVLAIGPGNLTVETRARLSSSPWPISNDPNADRIYVANSDGTDVQVLNGSTLAPAAPIEVSHAPIAFAYVPSSQTTYVLGSSEEVLQTLPDGSRWVTANVSLWGGPGIGTPGYDEVNGLAFSAGTGDLYVAQVVSPTVAGGEISLFSQLNLSVVDPQNDSRVGSIDVTGLAGVTDPSLLAGVVAIPGTTDAVVADPWSGYVFGLGLTNGSRLWRTAVAGDPTAETFDPATGTLDATVPDQNELVEIAPANGTIVGTIRLAGEPTALGIDPLNGRLYVALDGVSGANGGIEELNDSSGEWVGTVPVPGTLGPGIAFLSQTGTVGVSAVGSSSVFILGQEMVSNASVAPSQVQGEPFEIAGNAMLGAPPYDESVVGAPGCTAVVGAAAPVATCTVLTAGAYHLEVTVSDAAGESNRTSLPITVTPYPLTIAIAGDTAVASGSTANYAVAWSPGEAGVVAATTLLSWSVLPSGSATLNRTTGAAVAATFSGTGSVRLLLSASFNGTNASSQLTVNVGASGSFLGLSDLEAVGLFAGVTVVVALAAVAVWRSRRKHHPVAPP